MTAVSLRLGGHYGPTIIGAATNLAISGTGIGLAWVFVAETSSAVTHIGFRYGARVGTPCTMVATIETVDATTGSPSGTDAGGGSATAKTFTPPADTTWDGTWQEIALTNSVVLTVGTAYAITIRYSSGTPDSSTFTRSMGERVSLRTYPYALTLAAASWTKVAGPLFSYKTATSVYGYPAVSSSATAVTTSGHRACMHFTMTSGVASSFIISRIDALIRPGSAAGSCKVGIWNNAGTELQAETVDSDIVVALTNRVVEVTFNSPATLSVGTKYYIGVECVSSATVILYGTNLGSAADREPYPNGLNQGYSAWDGASWTDTNTIMPHVDITLSDITAPSGSGGGYVIGS